MSHTDTPLLCGIREAPVVYIKGHKFQLELHEPEEKYQEIARNELRESPERTKAAVEELRTLLKEEKDLYFPVHNDPYLVRFLRPCKFYPESARDLIKKYFHFKEKNSKYFDNISPKNEQNVFLQDLLTILPGRDQLGRRVVIIELGKKWNYKKCTLDEIIRGAVVVLEGALTEPTTQITGGVIVFDMDGLTLQHAWQFNPAIAKRIVELLQDAMPLRIKNLHIVCQPYIFNMVFTLFKPFLNEKFKSRIIFHGHDMNSFYKYIDQNALTVKYGGPIDLGEGTGKMGLDYMHQLEAEFDEINKYGYKKK